MSNALDKLFEQGPVGFLNDEDGPSRLRRVLCALDSELPLQAPPVQTLECGGSPDISDEQFVGADAWKADAIRRWHGLWTGNSDDIEGVFGVSAPTQLAAFQRATHDAETWSSLYELRLEGAQIRNAPEDENLFEKCVLNDQLNYLGTALPEVFSDLVCIGTLGNGDSYHMQLRGDAGAEPSVFLWNHETHAIEGGFAVDLESLVFLSALCKADEEELVSEEVASQGYAQLRKKVAPSWHFSMEDRDEDFEPWEPTSNATEFFWYRSRWIHYLLRQDGHVPVEDTFAPQLNVAWRPEELPALLNVFPQSSRVALYILWRAYLFGEEELPQYLELGRTHTARLVRDATKLIDELIAGRKTLGRIQDWPAVLQRFRDLDLDPRRAEAREREAAEKARAVKNKRFVVRAELRSIAQADELAFVERHFLDGDVQTALLDGLLQKPWRENLTAATDVLRDDEQHLVHEEASRYIAKHSDAALSLAALGSFLATESALSRQHCFEIAVATSTMPPAGALALRNLVATLDLEVPAWFELSILKLLRAHGTEDAVKPLCDLLAKIPSEGGFETALRFDAVVSECARTLNALGDPQAAEALAPFASSQSMRMFASRVESAWTIACLAPEAFTKEMADRALEFMAKRNDGAENGLALLAIAKAMPDYAPARSAKPIATDAAEVILAQGLLSNDEEAINEAFREGLTPPTCSFAEEQWSVLLRACEVFELRPEPSLLANGFGISAALDARIVSLGGNENDHLNYFEVAALNDDELAAVLRSRKRGRRYAATLAQGKPHLRGALEDALRAVDPETSRQGDPFVKACVSSLMSLPIDDHTTNFFAGLVRKQLRFQIPKALAPSMPVFEIPGRSFGGTSHGGILCAVGEGGEVWRHDGTWSEVYKHKFQLSKALLLSQDHLLVAGMRGELAESRDGGSTWATSQVGGQRVHALMRGPKGSLFVAGNGGSLFVSRDEGATWTRLNAPSNDHILGLSVLSESEFFVCTQGGRVHGTSDGGKTWHGSEQLVSSALCRVHAFNSQNLIAVGDANVVLRSNDGGCTWAPQDTGTTGDIEGLCVGNDGRLYAVTSRAELLISGDRGETWTAERIGNYGQWSITATDSGALFCTGNQSLTVLTGYDSPK